MTHKRIQTRIRVLLSDTTVHGEVRSSKYWDYFEAAENDFYRALGRPENTLYDNLGLPRIAARLDHLRPASLDDLLEISLYIGRITRSTFTFAFDITRLGATDRGAADAGAAKPVAPDYLRPTQVARGELVICCVDGEGKSRRIPADILQGLLAYYPGAASPFRSEE